MCLNILYHLKAFFTTKGQGQSEQLLGKALSSIWVWLVSPTFSEYIMVWMALPYSIKVWGWLWHVYLPLSAQTHLRQPPEIEQKDSLLKYT